MNEDLENKVRGLLALLSPNQAKISIAEFDETLANREIREYLSSIGRVDVKYSVETKVYREFRQIESCTPLWYLRSDGVWVVYLYEIAKLLT